MSKIKIEQVQVKSILSKSNLPVCEYSTKGQDYRNTPFLQVYGHNGELCLNCGNTLCRTVIGDRSSVYCPNCQKD